MILVYIFVLTSQTNGGKYPVRGTYVKPTEIPFGSWPNFQVLPSTSLIIALRETGGKGKNMVSAGPGRL
jgi:hypothetical protein